MHNHINYKDNTEAVLKSKLNNQRWYLLGYTG